MAILTVQCYIENNGKTLMLQRNKKKNDIQECDKVIINKYSGTEVKFEGTEYTIVKQEDILAIVE